MNWVVLGTKVKAAREMHRKNQDDLAAEAKVSRATVSKVEGGGAIRWGGLYRIGVVLGLTHDKDFIIARRTMGGGVTGIDPVPSAPKHDIPIEEMDTQELLLHDFDMIDDDKKRTAVETFSTLMRSIGFIKEKKRPN